MFFDIQPYTGADPIMFGMTREQVHSHIGPPESSFPIWDGSGVSEHYNRAQYNIAYCNDGLVKHVGLSPGGADLAILGRPIWTGENQTDPNPILLTLDPKPLEFVGTWFFMEIGVTTTGYHDDDPSDWAVTVFTKGSMDELLDKLEKADTSKYRR